MLGRSGWTFSDLERAIALRLRKSGLLDWERWLLAQETAAREKALLAALTAKYGAGSQSATPDQPQPLMVSGEASQTDLFARTA